MSQQSEFCPDQSPTVIAQLSERLQKYPGINQSTFNLTALAINLFQPNSLDLWQAITHTAKIHTGQKRLSGEEYPNHTMMVGARIPVEFGIVDEELFIAGLYHDSVEDQITKLTEIQNATRDEAYDWLEQNYSRRVAKAVEGVTNSTKPVGLDRVQKNQLYLDHVVEACDTNPDCFIIKLSDFLDNSNITNIKTLESRHRQSTKYTPLADYFINRLESGYSTLDDYPRTEIINILSKRRQSMMWYLNITQ